MKLKCNCKHKDQDLIHGKNIRVHNSLTKQEKRPQEYRCTVCGVVRTG